MGGRQCLWGESGLWQYGSARFQTQLLCVQNLVDRKQRGLEEGSDSQQTGSTSVSWVLQPQLQHQASIIWDGWSTGNGPTRGQGSCASRDLLLPGKCVRIAQPPAGSLSKSMLSIGHPLEKINFQVSLLLQESHRLTWALWGSWQRVQRLQSARTAKRMSGNTHVANQTLPIPVK